MCGALLCCRKKKPKEESRRTSMLSKKQSLAPTIPPPPEVSTVMLETITKLISLLSIAKDSRPRLNMVLVDHASMMKGAIPVLPMCLAWFCMLCNIFIPGTGKRHSC